MIDDIDFEKIMVECIKRQPCGRIWHYEIMCVCLKLYSTHKREVLLEVVKIMADLGLIKSYSSDDSYTLYQLIR